MEKEKRWTEWHQDGAIKDSCIEIYLRAKQDWLNANPIPVDSRENEGGMLQRALRKIYRERTWSGQVQTPYFNRPVKYDPYDGSLYVHHKDV